MAKPTLSVVIPVFNEAVNLPETIGSLLRAVEQGGFDAEIVLVDDGSTDGSAGVAQDAAADRAPLRILTQPNRGRFEARRRGVEAAEGDWVLLLDGRVQIDLESLAQLRQRLDRAPVWTAHVYVAADGDLLGSFWGLIAELAWSDYFNNPREASFGPEEFDRYPKGTTCFLCPRELLLDAIGAFHSRYVDLRDANDDTPMLRWIAERERIHVSPAFSCRYRPRTSFRSFMRHSVHRGVVFLDGHGRLESRFFPAVIAFYPLSGAMVLAALRKPRVLPAELAATSLAAVTLGLARRRTAAEVVSLALVTPLYCVAHGYGMWRGLVKMLRPPPPAGSRR